MTHFETLLIYECSVCGGEVEITAEHFSGVYAYCSVCGAKYQVEVAFIEEGEDEFVEQTENYIAK